MENKSLNSGTVSLMLWNSISAEYGDKAKGVDITFCDKTGTSIVLLIDENVPKNNIIKSVSKLFKEMPICFNEETPLSSGKTAEILNSDGNWVPLNGVVNYIQIIFLNKENEEIYF